MSVAELVDEEVVRHIALYGFVRNADPMVQHLLKHSQDPVLRFRRWWMRKKALQQHLAAERRQQKSNDAFKRIPINKKASVWQEASIDPFLAAEMQHYGKTTLNDPKFLSAVKAEAPAIFPKRDAA